jgi:tripartite-type tricarboxylate transporter receptor subunit TctC
MRIAWLAYLGIAACAGGASAQEAQAWTPEEPIEIIVGFAPGGGSDQVARNISAAAEDVFPVPLVVVNQPGAAGVLAAQEVARAEPDGYTLLVAGGSESTSVPAHREVPYDPGEDFEAIMRLTNNPYFYVVSADSPYQTIEDLIEAARENPGEITQANSGVGSLAHSIGLMLEEAAGIELKHVPYQGGAPGLQALVAGQVDTTVGATEEILGQVQAGTIRVLASTGAERSAHYPDVPTLTEKGFEVVATNMKGLVAPAGTPPEVIGYLHEHFRQAMEADVWQDFAERVGEPDNYQDGPTFEESQVEQLERVSNALQN